MRICKVDGCESKSATARTVCNKHYQRWSKYKSYNLPPEKEKVDKPPRICRVENCESLVIYSNRKGTLCEVYRYNKMYYGSFERPVKKEMPYLLQDKTIVHSCKIHGELTIDQTKLNSVSKKGKQYYRCKVCRNEQERTRINKTIYETIPRKHTKTKLPDFVTDKPHAYTIFHRFKMTAIEYRDRLKTQNFICAICNKPETLLKVKSDEVRMLSVDHCHETGKIRGLLCHACNTALGSFKDSIENLQSAINYLSFHEN